MPALGTFAYSAALNLINLGSTAITAAGNAPTAWWLGLSTSAPTTASGFELGAGSGYTRQTCTFGAAAAAGSASNNNAMTFGSFNATGTMSGVVCWNNATIGSNTAIWYGNLATPRTVSAGDSLVVAQGALTVTLT
jgi:hypothetical protein